jgi:hypothetical protein
MFFANRTRNQKESEKSQIMPLLTNKKRSNISNPHSSNPQPQKTKLSKKKRAQNLPSPLAFPKPSQDSIFLKIKAMNPQNKI